MCAAFWILKCDSHFSLGCSSYLQGQLLIDTPRCVNHWQMFNLLAKMYLWDETSAVLLTARPNFLNLSHHLIYNFPLWNNGELADWLSRVWKLLCSPKKSSIWNIKGWDNTKRGFRFCSLQCFNLNDTFYSYGLFPVLLLPPQFTASNINTVLELANALEERMKAIVFSSRAEGINHPVLVVAGIIIFSCTSETVNWDGRCDTCIYCTHRASGTSSHGFNFCYQAVNHERSVNTGQGSGETGDGVLVLCIQPPRTFN